MLYGFAFKRFVCGIVYVFNALVELLFYARELNENRVRSFKNHLGIYLKGNLKLYGGYYWVFFC